MKTFLSSKRAINQAFSLIEKSNFVFFFSFSYPGFEEYPVVDHDAFEEDVDDDADVAKRVAQFLTARYQRSRGAAAR